MAKVGAEFIGINGDFMQKNMKKIVIECKECKNDVIVDVTKGQQQVIKCNNCGMNILVGLVDKEKKELISKDLIKKALKEKLGRELTEKLGRELTEEELKEVEEVNIVEKTLKVKAKRAAYKKAAQEYFDDIEHDFLPENINEEGKELLKYLEKIEFKIDRETLQEFNTLNAVELIYTFINAEISSNPQVLVNLYNGDTNIITDKILEKITYIFIQKDMGKERAIELLVELSVVTSLIKNCCKEHRGQIIGDILKTDN